MIALLLLVAQDAEAVERLRESVEFLASDELEGRSPGNPGNERAAEWIVERFREAGLQPPSDDSYRQEFQMRSGRQRVAVANIWGAIPGREREIVLVGAHYDHIGVSGSGPDRIHNGADDNASGTAVLVEAARTLGAREDWRPRRTVVFVAFNGEESGLLGSWHYSRNPLVPLEEHAAMVNLDMLGRNPGTPVQIDGVGTASMFRSILVEEAEEADLATNPLTLGDIVEANSDHWPFYSNRVPTVSFFTGYHDDYHAPGDHADLLAYDRMGKIAQVVAELVRRLAEYDGDIRFHPAFGLTAGEALGEAELREFGFPRGAGAVQVSRISTNSVLARAGVQRGDVIVAWNREPLDAADPSADLERRAEGANRARLTILREGQTVDLDLVWE